MAQVAQAVHQLVQLVLPFRLQPTHQVRPGVLDGGMLLAEISMPGVSDGIDLASLLLLQLDIPQVFEHLEGRVHHAGAGRVLPREARLQGPHQLVAMPWLLGEQAQEDVLELSLGERPAAMMSPAKPPLVHYRLQPASRSCRCLSSAQPAMGAAAPSLADQASARLSN